MLLISTSLHLGQALHLLVELHLLRPLPQQLQVPRVESAHPQKTNRRMRPTLINAAAATEALTSFFPFPSVPSSSIDSPPCLPPGLPPSLPALLAPQPSH